MWNLTAETGEALLSLKGALMRHCRESNKIDDFNMSLHVKQRINSTVIREIHSFVKLPVI